MTLPEGWVETTVAEVATVNPKHDPDTDREQAVSFVPMPAVDGHLGAIVEPVDRTLDEIWKGFTHFAEGDVIFAKITPCMENGKAAIARGLTNGLACGSTEFYVLRPDADVQADYLWRYLRQRSYRSDAEIHMTGAVGQRRVPRQYLEASHLPLPPAAEQRRIVAKLDALTARLARARAELDRVPVLAERAHLALLRAGVTGSLTAEWRGASDVEPIANTLARVPTPKQGRGGREPTDNVIRGTAGIAINDPATQLPPGWAWVPLLRVAKQETGHTPSRSKPEYWDGGVPWIGIRDAGAHHGREIETTMQTISKEGLANSSARLLPAGTVCLSRTASVGYVTMMKTSMATSQDFATWTCTEALHPEYLLYALMAEGDDIRRFGMGSTHTTIYFPEIRAVQIALPPVKEQREIVARLKLALARADRMKDEAARARTLIDRLEAATLAKAFRGELVPQDPDDEPASVLLDRIRAQRVATPKPQRRRRKKAEP